MSRYEYDFYAWIHEQVTLLREQRFSELDVDHLIEELEAMGRSERREAWNRLFVLLTHLLKWEYQPEHRSRSWQATIREQRRQLRRLLADSPGLRSLLPTLCAEAYAEAREEAMEEADLAVERFPDVCPWTVEEVLKEHH